MGECRGGRRGSGIDELNCRRSERPKGGRREWMQLELGRSPCFIISPLLTSPAPLQHDPVASIKAHSSCVRLVDLNGDRSNILLVADENKKMRVYKGTSIVAEVSIGRAK